MSHIAKRLTRDSKAGCLITGSLQARCRLGTRMFRLIIVNRTDSVEY